MKPLRLKSTDFDNTVIGLHRDSWRACLKHAGTTPRQYYRQRCRDSRSLKTPGQWRRCTKADRRPVSNYQGTCQASSNIDYAVMLYKLQIGHFVPHSDGPP